MTLVAGIDSSTQSCKVVVREAETGDLVREGRAAHPDGTEVAPASWVRALHEAIDEAGGLDDVAAVAVGAQQHGMVLLDEQGEVVRDALLWNDTRSAPQAETLIHEYGGRDRWADSVGVVPVASFTATKLRWVSDNEPDNADRTAAVCLPHDYLTWQLSQSSSIHDLVTDRGDASGTAYFSAKDNRYVDETLDLAFGGRRPVLPRVLGPHDQAGQTPAGTLLGPGTGDNAAAALALGATTGDLVVSLGTSGVLSAVTATPSADPEGYVAGFADASGQHLPLVCTLNGAPVLAQVADLLGVSLTDLSDLALSAPAGAEGVVLVPWFAGERSPDLPNAKASLHGLTLANATRANIARAAVEGLLCTLVIGAGFIAQQGIKAERALLVGGGARSQAIREIAPSMFGVPVEVPQPGEYVANGAARQAAWVLSGEPTAPQWTSSTLEVGEPPTNSTGKGVLDQYCAVTDHLLAQYRS